MKHDLMIHQPGLIRSVATAGSSSESGVPIAPMATWYPGASPSLTPPHTGMTPSTPLPPPNNLPPRVLTERESQLVKHLSRLQFFLATAPTRWMGSEDSATKHRPSLVDTSLSSPHPNLNKFLLPNGEHVACVFWNGLYHITGTDIVRALVFRFEAFSRPVRNVKKFEEGVFSDLRNLKPGTDACLEEPKSPFLDLLFRNGCIRTQKKQKVFYWFSVPHDRLFLDALERDLKREKMGLEPTTVVVGEPARSFRYDPKRSLFEQFAGKQPGLEDTVVTRGEGTAEPSIKDYHSPHFEITPPHHLAPPDGSGQSSPAPSSPHEGSDVNRPGLPTSLRRSRVLTGNDERETLACPATANNVLFSRSLLKGSPAYKQGRKRVSREKKRRASRDGASTSGNETADDESGSETERLRKQPTETPGGASILLLRPPSKSTPSGIVDEHPSSFRTIEDPTAAPLLPLLSLSHVNPTLPAAAGDNSLSTAHHLSWSSKMEEGSSRVHGSFRDEVNLLPTLSHGGDRDKFQSFDSLGSGSRLASASILRGFSCPLLSCGRLFKRLEHLKRHVRTHTQERPYECARCSKRFSRSDNLTQHYKTHEKQDRGERDRSERQKTEVSEAADEDMGAYLEAQVDAQAEALAKHSAEYFGIGNGGMTPPGYPMSGNLDMPNFTRHGVASLSSSTPHMAHGPDGYSHHLLATGHSGHRYTTTKRPRSMTPSLSSTRAMSIPARGLHPLASRTDYLFHPYTSASSLPTTGQGQVQRATSVDPHIFQSRPHNFQEQSSLSGYPNDSLLPFSSDTLASGPVQDGPSGGDMSNGHNVQPVAPLPSPHQSVITGADHATVTQPPNLY